jgi:hypothetical protein
VARGRGGVGLLQRLSRRVGLAETPALELAEKQGDGLVDDVAELAVGQLATQEGLGPAELVAQFGAGRKLDLIAGRGDRLEDRGPGRRRINCVWAE